jgi:hypothetical protein
MPFRSTTASRDRTATSAVQRSDHAGPSSGSRGAVYLERGFVESLPVELRPRVPGGRDERAAARGHDHVYWPCHDDPRAGKRYTGHCAEIQEESGSLAYAAVYSPGSSEHSEVRPATSWLDLASGRRG